ncbi:VRR-NUC domain-containing protein [Seongchinamella sediminis]|uniref:phosphodiesterase I n=1 Tax=Seongchinamella sediminis TaxID=2283635 RepID=A0A3L7E4P8_9GAMM|nr:VRR-NUC domain-containing protein [Seongchinamella sediminis]RLQ23511.1 VRR-NUC domain-containing protein [Seongchinamella sediminis]
MPDLAPHYYRDNFLRLLDTVESQYGDILSVQEQTFLNAYRQQPFDAQCLYVRLVSRLGPWFRERKLDYPELDDQASALGALLAAGLALLPDGLDAEALGRLCTRRELAAMFAITGRGKGEQLQALAALPAESLLPTLLECDRARVVAPAYPDTVALLQLLFFGNRRQGLTDFVLSDLGVARYYPYQVDRGNRLFPGRAELDEYLACAAQADRWWELREADDLAGMLDLARELAASRPRFATTLPRWYRVCNRLGRQLERGGHSAPALQLYRLSELHPARERAARVLEQEGDVAQAYALCQAIAEQPWCEEELDAARRMAPRLARKLDGRPQPRRRDRFDELHLQLPRADGGVELLAASALRARWPTVHYVENLLLNGLFGLAFWEQIFAPVPGAFNNPFQSAPADMYEQSFQASRRDMLSARLEQLAGTDLARELPRLWRRYAGYQCRWVNWKYLDEALVTAAAQVIPGQHLLAIWRRMLFDPGENRRGFPDLLALGSSPGNYRMIEVKGPGDALQDSQRRWLRFFAREGIPASVARVEWADD